MRPILNLAFVVVLLATLMRTDAFSTEVNETTIPDTLNAGETELILNGIGLRTLFGFKVYYASLYLPQKRTSAQAIIDADEPQAVTMTMKRRSDSRKIQIKFLRSLATSAGIPDQKLFTMESDYGIYTKQITTYVGWLIEDETLKGHCWKMIYTPDKGVDVYTGSPDKPVFKGTIPGYEFKRILWGVWLSPKEIVGKHVTEGMLGKR